jgi:selenide,water dikinase
LIVGFKEADDAAVYKLSDDLAIVQTVDLITVCFPTEKLDISILRQILKGARDKLNEAGVAMVGGHSIQDDEVKFGLSVTGVVHPQQVVTNGGARVGDKIILTKPLGSGVQSTALKAKLLDDKETDILIRLMTTLNNKASKVMLAFEAHACTDISGFGLIGHICEVAKASDVAVALDSGRVPYISGVDRLVSLGLIPAAMYANRDFRLDMVEVGTDIADWMINVLFDPQTSGGLLIAAAATKASAMLGELKASGSKDAAIIGEVVKKPRDEIRIIIR